MPKPDCEWIWTRAFALLCLAEFLGYAQHFLLQPTFPLYITHLGGSPFVVGLVIASFGVTSVISRPIIGYWADRWSITGVMILGLFTQTFANFICFIPHSVATMLANGLRGIGWSGMNTGGYTLLATAARRTAAARRQATTAASSPPRRFCFRQWRSGSLKRPMADSTRFSWLQ